MMSLKAKMEGIRKMFSSRVSNSEMEAAGERVLKRLHEEVPELIEAFRYNPKVGVLARELRPFHRLVLTTVRLLRGRGYSVTILDKMNELTGKRHSQGATYSALEDLHRAELVDTHFVLNPGDTYSRRLFTITEMGERVLAAVIPADEVSASELAYGSESVGDLI